MCGSLPEFLLTAASPLMCGLNAIFRYRDRAPPVDREELLRTRDHMQRRGPDGAGEWKSSDGRVGLGHRRLAIIDLTGSGAQPMVSTDGTLVVAFNGEIYNHRELRALLVAKGRVFRSTSDTEVLLHLYAEAGAGMLCELRGMFAFALYDVVARKMLLARDPYGIKPLYYSDDGATLRVASQVKALIAGGRCDTSPDPAGWPGFHLFGNVPEPFTVYRGIRALPAGCSLTFTSSGPEPIRRYHSIAATLAGGEAKSRRPVTAAEGQQAFREALRESVRHHLVSDVPVGAFLSAGIDSGALVGLMRDEGVNEINTVTLAYDEYRSTHDDEAPLASVVAAHYATAHTTRYVARNEFREDLPRILEAMDQPTIDGLNTWFVAKAAREIGLKVAISGLGGDELLGGYPSFHDIPRWVGLLSTPSRFGLLGANARKAGELFGVSRFAGSPKAAGLLELGGTLAGAYIVRRGLFMPWELETVMDRDFALEGMRRLLPLEAVRAAIEPDPATDFARVAALESSLYMRNQLLRDADWASMAHSLEVRTPLADSGLLSQVARLNASTQLPRTKVDLAHAPSRPLPVEVVSRSKSGFGIPVESWIDLPADKMAAKPTRGTRSRQWARHIAALGGMPAKAA